MKSISNRSTDIYFIAEFNTSHFGDVALAKKMIDNAKDIGVNCVKFQSWSSTSLYSQSYYSQNPMAKRFVKKYELSEDELLELSDYCQTVNIDFLSTPYSVKEAEFLLDTCKAGAIKIASMEINNLEYLKVIASKNTQIFLSTGMASLEEIRDAVNVILSNGSSKLCIFHCISQYPTDLCDANILNVKMLKDEFPEVEIGYSDHTLGNEAAMAAVALGATVIERHFTLDSKRIGMDNNMATEPKEFGELITCRKNIKQALGNYNRTVSDEEFSQRSNMRRSVVYARDLSPGHIITPADICVKRPGTGIVPTDASSVLGRKLCKDVTGDTLAMWDDFEN